MLDRLKQILKRNKNETTNIRNENISDGAMKDRVAIINNQNDVIDKYISENDRIDNTLERLYQERNNKNKELVDCDICELEEEKKDTIKILYGERQGKIKDIISAYFNQVDKRIYNFIFNSNSKISKLLSKKHENRVYDRYDSLAGYVTKNSLIICALFLISIMGNHFFPGLSILFKMLEVSNACFITNTAIKTISTIYNKCKFGGINLSKFKKILRGNYIENIKSSKNAYQRAKELTNINIPTNENGFDIYIPAPKDMAEFDEKYGLDDIEIEKPNISDYGNLGMCAILKDDAMKYSESISVIRHNSDNDNRQEAYAKLANTFGRSKKKKSKTLNTNKLNDFTKTLKLVSQYGRKIRSAEATNDDVANYFALLYHLGKDFDDDYDITDFLSDEYDRYQEDVRNYEEQCKVLKKLR